MQNQIVHFLIFFVSIFAAMYRWLIFAYILLSWFPHGWVKFRGILAQIVEPVLKLFSFARIGNISFSAIIAFIAIDYLGKILIGFLISLL